MKLQTTLGKYIYLNRSILAENLRKSPYAANCLIAGVDDKGAHLYWLDYLGSLQKVTKGALGYGSHFLYGIMDNYYNSNFSIEEGRKCVAACIKELTTRFVIALENFTVRLIDKDGITDISAEYIKAK
jgi:20S proteasome alpha/beta subunit